MYLNAITFYRLGKFLKKLHIPFLPRICELIIFLFFNSSIPVDYEIGEGTICGHKGIGVVISKDAKIRKNYIKRKAFTKKFKF